MILILDYGSQYTQLLARRVREMGVFSEVQAYDASIKMNSKVKGVILSGGPYGVYEKAAPRLPQEILDMDVPILGVCYGAQLLTQYFGGHVSPAAKSEFGSAKLQIQKQHDIFKDIDAACNHIVWMSHGDKIERLGKGFQALASSPHSPFAAFAHVDKNIVGVQFHPEVVHSAIGTQFLKNFVLRMCQAKTTWTMENFGDREIQKLKAHIGDQNVICALSGGVDSSVVALMLHKAIGKQLTSVFVDHGMLRKGEREQVQKDLQQAFDMNLVVVDAKPLFFEKLTGVTDPEKKRKIIGQCFVDVFNEESRKLKDVKFLAQGTLYPDVIESVAQRGPAQTIKTHHNVGGLPKDLKFELIEPLRDLFKDEVRRLGNSLGLQDRFVSRHPFPGPGLAIRILGEVNEKDVALLQEADSIFIEELRNWNLYHETWQALAVLLPIQSVGVMGDQRTYEKVCALRAVTSVDGMTAKHAELPHDFLAHVSSRIINEVKGINRVVYDISSKPPSTIEWE